MTASYNVKDVQKIFLSSLGQMALESTICCIVHHTRRTRAHCRPWFRVLNSHQGQSAYSGLVAENFFK